jgi:hypothetical protein
MCRQKYHLLRNKFIYRHATHQEKWDLYLEVHCATADNAAETSSRVSTNDRKKVKDKVRESRKKKKKAAKKTPQWKSSTLCIIYT